MRRAIVVRNVRYNKAKAVALYKNARSDHCFTCLLIPTRNSMICLFLEAKTRLRSLSTYQVKQGLTYHGQVRLHVNFGFQICVGQSDAVSFLRSDAGLVTTRGAANDISWSQ
jgi:hypothetical protein